MNTKLLALGLTALSIVATVAPSLAHAQSARTEVINRRTNLRSTINRMRGQMTESEFRTFSRAQTQIEGLKTDARRDGQVDANEAQVIDRAVTLQVRRIVAFRSNFNARNTQQIH